LVFAKGNDQKILEIKEYLGTVFSEDYPGCRYWSYKKEKC